MRKSTCYIGFMLIFGSAFLTFAAVSAVLQGPEYRRAAEQRRQLVITLQLTDLCLFTEARYTRHLSQADLHSAFQNHPMGFDHFPSGALTAPPIRNAAGQPGTKE